MSSFSPRTPTSARNRPSLSTIRPRIVLRKLSGASEISLSRKCGASPRSMSRVVTSARTNSAESMGSSRPSNARRFRPDSSPARDPSRTTICPDGASALPVAPSPSMRRYVDVSSTTPYGSLATMKLSSARPMNKPCPLPRSETRSWSGLWLDIAPIATEPSKDVTLRLYPSTRSPLRKV